MSYYAESGDYAWSAYHAVRHIRLGSDWSNVISPSAQFLTDVAGGKLASVTWITPSLLNFDHSSSESASGPEWVASLVNAVGTSPFRKSTAIFVMWDEWGGWYDHVPPPQLDYDGLGFRVPLLVISPYAKAGYVSHVRYEHGSVLGFIEDLFGLGRLADSDTRSNSAARDCFDFAQTAGFQTVRDDDAGRRLPQCRSRLRAGRRPVSGAQCKK